MRENIRNKFIEQYLNKRYKCNDGEFCTVIKYIDAYNVTVKFDDGYIKNNVQSSHLKRGNVKNPNPNKLSNSLKPTFFNVGYMGIGKWSSTNQEKFYILWVSMLTRCYDLKYKSKYPTYDKCIVSDRWKNFQNFVDDCYLLEYKPNYVLDKDILIKNNKIYSFETCCFVPEEINKKFEKCNARRGNTYIGVTNTKEGKFRASCIQENTTSTHIGIFNNQLEAFNAYKEMKEKNIREMATKFISKISEKVFKVLIEYKVEITD